MATKVPPSEASFLDSRHSSVEHAPLNQDDQQGSDGYEIAGSLAAKEELDVESQKTSSSGRTPSNLIVWITINVFATTAIVFINKSIFDDPDFRGAQLSFATFHFLVTFTTLHIVSTVRVGFFERKMASVRQVLPLAAAMCLNVVLPNLSLMFSSIAFYQTARVLLTPITAFLDYVLYEKTIPRRAVYALIPVCLGVAMVTYYDVRPSGSSSNATNVYGVFFALSGVLVSGIYTVQIGHYHRKLHMTSVQLLHNQSLLGGMMLMYLIPFVDVLPVIGEVAWTRWLMIVLSGLCACLLNLSQFAIIADAGSVASTVVGHTKTVTIVTLGWIWSGGFAGGPSLVGVVVAIGGIISYSAATTVFGT